MHCVDAGHCSRRREVAWSVCLCQPVGHDSRPRVLQKRLNRSKYRVGVDSGELYDGGPHLLREAAFWQWCIRGYTRVYAVYQPPGFFDSVYSPQ